MSETILDRLEVEHGQAREFLAEQIVAGSSNAQLADALAAKFGIAPPTVRSISTWVNHDKRLLAEVAALREDGADVTRATATVVAALEARLENPDKLSVAELVEIKKALARQSASAAAVGALREEGNGIPHEIIDSVFFSLAQFYGEEGERFTDVMLCEYVPAEDWIDFIPAAADVEAMIAEAEATVSAAAGACL